MTGFKRFSLTLAAIVAATSLAIVRAQNQPKAPAQEQERNVKEAEVPAAALAALKKLAGTNAITGFEEEIEHGQKFYEGEWKTAGGKVEAKVTEAGDLVEIEEGVGGDAVPKAALIAALRVAGKDAPIRWEKKTCVMYEAKFKKGDKYHEVLLTPDGRDGGHEDKDDNDNDGDED